MVYLAKELERLNVSIPLLIGGATTSRVHTAVKIAPEYSGSVVHVADASRAVTVASSLLAADLKQTYQNKIRNEYKKLRDDYLGRAKEKSFLSLEDARKNKFKIDWDNYNPVKPKFLGIKVVTVAIQELIPFIDWTPFFNSWQIFGKYPAILSDAVVGKQAQELFEHANLMLKQIIDKNWLTAKGVLGIFPANTIDFDDIEVKIPNTNGQSATFLTLRQQTQKTAGAPNIALADFIAPIETNKQDYIGCFCVTTGFGVEERAAAFELEFDDYQSILIKAVADRLAEAFAEYLHLQVRKDLWGYNAHENLTNEDLINESYQGIRPAPGYPACPDHLEKQTIWNILDVEKQIGVKLTESMAMWPASSVSGYYFGHPESKYFGLGKINDEQVANYAKRRNISLATAKKWLSPNLIN
jgi:5-methyltetrahydrofolate--homocysteine methyltransferase